MNPQIEASMVEILKWVKEAKEFTTAQAPDVVAQMLAYGAWDSIYSIKVFGIAALICLAIAIYDVFISETGILSVLFGVGFLTFLFGTACSYSTLKKIQMSPKLYVIDQIAEMGKDKK